MSQFHSFCTAAQPSGQLNCLLFLAGAVDFVHNWLSDCSPKFWSFCLVSLVTDFSHHLGDNNR